MHCVATRYDTFTCSTHRVVSVSTIFRSEHTYCTMQDGITSHTSSTVVVARFLSIGILDSAKVLGLSVSSKSLCMIYIDVDDFVGMEH